MKKLSSILLTLLLILSLMGCTAEPGAAPTPGLPEAIPSASEAAQNEPPPETKPASESSFSVHFIDVGQADAALVACDGHYLLIDGGNRADSDRIYAIVKREQVPVFDLVVGTHAHEDHIGGIPGALHYAAARTTLCPVTAFDSKAFENFSREAARSGGGITVPHAGDTYPLGSAQVTILGLNSGDSVNDTSIVLRIDYGRTSFLFTGDAETDTETALLNAGANLSATVLKVGHHGSDTSTGEAFLRQIQPEYAVISCGADNPYGHPDGAVLDRLHSASAKVFRTDLQGDIFCTSDGETVTFTVSKNPEINTLEPPEPQNFTESDCSGDTRYILNTSSGKFHRPDCSSVGQMSGENKKEVTCGREDLIRQGYQPCKRCKP